MNEGAKRVTIRKRTLIKALLISAITLVVLFAAAWFFVDYQVSHLENYKDSITKAMEKALNRNVAFDKVRATLTWQTGFALQFTNIAVKDIDRATELLNIPNAFFRVDILPLLQSRLVLREVILRHPRLSLQRDRGGVLNIADLLTGGQKPGMALELRKLTLEKGLVTFLDQSISAEGLVTSLANLSCRIDNSLAGNSLPFNITATVNEDKNQGELSFSGTFRWASSEKPFAAGTLDASLRLRGMDVHHYHPYLKSRVPLEQLAGHLDVETAFSGSLASFTAQGTVTVKNALIEYPQVFRGPLQPQAVLADCRLTRNAGHLKLDVNRLVIDRLEAKGSFAIENLDEADPQLAATAVTSFSLKEMQSYVPWGIIPKNVGSFIEAHIKEGDFRLVEGKLSGRQSQITHMEKPENAGVLFLRAEVDKGVFVINNTTPAFSDISGVLELKNREFMLKSMQARFGASPCTLTGAISDFALPAPAVYTANMTIEPSRDEIFWLFGKEKFRNFSFNGASTLTLSGKGPAENYRISARWDLTNIAYTWPSVLEKSRGRENLFAAEITLNKDAVVVSSFNYDLPPASVNGSATYRFAGKSPLSLNVQSNSFDIHDLVPVFPFLKTFDPAGTCLINAAFRGNPDDYNSFRWKGNVSLTDVSLKPSDSIKPVKGLTGKAVLRGNRLETSRFHARIGASTISGKCRINDFRKPQVACQFDSSLFRAADAGWQSPEGAVNFRDVKGQVTLADKNIRVDKLALRLGKSVFNLSGNIRGFAEPKITLAVHSPYINFADVARITTLQSSARKDQSSSRLDISATLQADAGAAAGVDFRNLNAEFKFAGETLNIKSLEAGIFDGKIKAGGNVDIQADGRNRYAANLTIDRVSLAKIQAFLDVKDRLVTGDLSLTGEVNATGRNADEWKKTATGVFQVRAEKGVLKKFSTLAKMFSLLNVLQLAKLQLPDMAEGGMPYDAITGKLSLQDGVLSSEDFFVDSNAMEISATGKVDLPKEELDATVGVHPLGTIDEIVSKIPIAGWLITDEKGHLVTVHFKVDGKWDDPRVTAIPVRSLAKGTLDIFRRLFQLPGKLITDTGEVILGH